jgi:hypothetical protein
VGDVIQGRFVNATPPGAHPALMAASDYGMACVRMAKATFGTREYDEAFAECNRLWEQMASACGVKASDQAQGDACG